MPAAIYWSADQDARLIALLNERDMSLVKAAKELGVSRSVAQRRACLLEQRNVASLCTRDREEAGSAPLPVGHPITWNAINWTALETTPPRFGSAAA